VSFAGNLSLGSCLGGQLAKICSNKSVETNQSHDALNLDPIALP